jgi:trk system potassium uptake protein TrkA
VHIVIMGCGRVGSSLARGLERRGHSVAVIDINQDAFRRLGPDFQGKTVKGVGFDRNVLRKAGIEKADGFAAVSSGDNSNILAARVVRETFEINTVVARIYDQGRAEVYERLGIPSVATVRWAADQILRRLLPSGSEPQWKDPSGTVRLIEVHADPGWVGTRLTAMQRKANCQIPFLVRFGVGTVPDSETIFQDGDLVYAAVSSEQVPEVEEIFGHAPTER